MLIALFSQYLKNVKVPFPGYNREQGGCYMGRSAIFRLFPVSKASLLNLRDTFAFSPSPPVGEYNRVI